MTNNKRVFITLLFFIVILSYSKAQITLNFSNQINHICNGNDCGYVGPTILINEVMLCPSSYDGSMYGDGPGFSPNTNEGEWIELYNPDNCMPIDISCYFLGNNANEAAQGQYDIGGGFAIPAGTIVPPRGFVLLRGENAAPVPSNLLIQNGGNTIEIIVNNLSAICLGGGYRLWFPNAGGWFAFYNQNGVPQDAISWNSLTNSNLAASPCNPTTSGCPFLGTLASYNNIPAANKTYISNTSPTCGQSFRRIPDGGTWAYNSPGTPTYGTCNSTCNPPPVITCDGVATVSVSGGTPPYSYTWNDTQSSLTSSATGLCEGTYCVTVTDANNVQQTGCVTILNFVPTVTFSPVSAICSNASPLNLTSYVSPSGGTFYGNGVTPPNFNPATAGPGNHTISYVYSDINTCEDSVTQVITVNPTPTATFTAQTPICIGDPALITYTGNGGSTFNWNFNGATILLGTLPTQGPYEITWNTAGTYSVTLQVTSANTCQSTLETHYIQVLAAGTPGCCMLPTPSAGPNLSFCGLNGQFQATPPDDPSYIGTWTQLTGPGTSSYGGGNNHSINSSVSVTQEGTYSYVWTEVNGSCISTDTVTMSFTQNPIANAGPDASICGLNYTLNAQMSTSGSGLWTGTGITLPSNPHSTVTVPFNGIYTFAWTETNGTCTSTDSVTINFLVVPVANAGPDATSCGQNVVLMADSTFPGWWTAVPSTAIYTDNMYDASPSIWIPSYTGASHNVVFTWHAYNGTCQGSDAVNITFMKPPHAEAGPDQSICGTTAQLHADTIGSGIVAAYWTNSAGVAITDGPVGDPIPWEPDVDASLLVPNFWVNSQHPVYFYWIAQNGPGCTSIDSVLVTFFEIPVANGGLNDSVCGQLYDLEGDWSIDNPSGIWSTQLPSPGIANFIPTNTPNGEVTVSQYGIYHFIWKEMNAGNTGCYDKDTVTIDFIKIPTPDAGMDFSVCGLCAKICATPTPNITGGQWSVPGGVAFYDTCGGIYSPNYKDSTCTWIRYSSENVFVTMYWSEFNRMCYGYDSVNVYFGSIQPAVSLVDPADSVVCGPVYTLLNAQDPAYGYGYWYDTVMTTTFTPTPIDPSPIASIDTGSIDYYGYHCFHWITVNGDCRDTSECVPVKFIENPIAYAGGNYWAGLFGPNSHIKTDTVCGLNYEMGAVPTIGDGLWYTQHTLSIFDSTDGNSTPDPTDSLYVCSALNACYSVFTQTGPQYYQYIWQENHENCVSSDTLRLYFAPYPSGQFTTTMPACRHDSSMIIAHTWPLPNNIDYGVTGFQWVYTGGTLVYPPDSIVSQSDTIYVSWPTGEQHNVSLIELNRWGCYSGGVTHAVTEPAPFNPTYVLTPTECMQNNGSIVLSTAHGSDLNYYTFQWLPGQDPIVNYAATTQLDLHPLTNYLVQVNGESLSDDATPGTICHDTLTIFVPDTGKIVASFDTLYLEDHQNEAAPFEVQLNNTTDNGRKFSWRFYDEDGNLISTSTQEDPLYTFANEGCYRIVLVVTSKQGCIDTAEYTPYCIDPPPILEIPNVFTPNGDGDNDYFKVHGKSILEFKAIIFNRWGKKIYEWNDVNKGWDGKIGSADASPGSYYYKITAKGKKETEYEFNGFFYLLREK